MPDTAPTASAAHTAFEHRAPPRASAIATAAEPIVTRHAVARAAATETAADPVFKRHAVAQAAATAAETKARRLPAPRGALIAALAAALVAATPHSAAATTCPDAALEPDAVTIDRVRAAVLCVVNEWRAGAGRGELRASEHLDRSAAAHSADMVEHGYLAHEDGDRPTLFQRVRAAGYFAGAADALFSENIGAAPLGAASAARLVDAWLLSPDHRANLLHPSFRDLGVGAAFAPPTPVFYADHPSVVFTTDFGRRELRPARAQRRCRRRSARPRAQDRPRGEVSPRRRYCRR